MFKFCVLFVIISIFVKLEANPENDDIYYSQSQVILRDNGIRYSSSYPSQCFEILKEFAENASNFTLCTILHARPITLCEKCIKDYVKFRDKYKELLVSVVNGTSCKSIFLSQDRLNAVQEYHDNILSVWDKGNCNDCYNWTLGIPSLKSTTIDFYRMSNDTKDCISKYNDPDNSEVCNKCMQIYEQLDEFYKTLSSDSIGVDSVCMDIVDSMNATRSTWSKTLNCCNLRRTPEVVFLSCAGIISFLPILYYITVRYCGPIRDLPNVLKQSRFKQTILRGLSIESRSD
ncbi:osteopetrosis-associated transmembrane protein 1 [Bicyclus anynana]|uniref:Osteopetrosis-associated transmembrane protein 1 n=1 Tax=Bicyclus anynana TaxID=110368 RepID=A0A6J1MZ73_BICAN|nr:osteopetrosis-associated transmembrane protein 1 [Bicyclus anynana]